MRDEIYDIWFFRLHLVQTRHKPLEVVGLACTDLICVLFCVVVYAVLEQRVKKKSERESMSEQVAPKLHARTSMLL